MATPTGPVPNLSETYRPSLYAAAIVTYVLATGAVILRFIARRLTRLNYWWDDWLVVVAWLAVTAFFIDEFIWIHKGGLGLHYQAVQAPYSTILYNIFLNLFIEDLFYSTGTVFCKLSLLAFYWRIFKVANIRWPIRILMACTILWLIARYIAITLHCIPVRAYWDKSITDATCHVNDRELFMGTNTVNFFLDLCVLILPMPYIKKLQIQKSQKIVVFGMFTLGGFIVAVSIILLVTCYKLDNTSPDVTWTLSPVALWAGTEINLGCVTACLPSLRPIFTFIKKGTARPDLTGGSSEQFSSNGVKSKATMSFTSRNRTVKAYSGTNNDDKHHPFSIINDRKNILDKHHDNDDPANSDSNVDLEEWHPPQDKVLVREDFSVNYSGV